MVGSVLPSRIGRLGRRPWLTRKGDDRHTYDANHGGPQAAATAMMVGNVIGAVGLILGFVRLSAGGAEAIKPVALLAVGILGVISFVRHSILHASDAGTDEVGPRRPH